MNADSARLLLRTGRAYAEEFMKSKCRLVPVGEDAQAVAITEFLQFLEPMRGIAGTVSLGHAYGSVCHGSFLCVQQAGVSRVSSPWPLLQLAK